jgi:hypothetical protein
VQALKDCVAHLTLVLHINVVLHNSSQRTLRSTCSIATLPSRLASGTNDLRADSVGL